LHALQVARLKMTAHRIRALARDHRAAELLHAAAARTAAEMLARGEPLTAAALHEAVRQYRTALLDALGAVAARGPRGGYPNLVGNRPNNRLGPLPIAPQIKF
jgi:hypothetical protein